MKKFDFVIGNPPYQEETTQEASKTNGQTPRKNVFHRFQLAADEVVESATLLVYPAGRWIHRSGKGMEDFGLKQINDNHLKKILFYPNSRNLFPNVDIPDGISIVLKDRRKQEAGFDYVYCNNGTETLVHMNPPKNELIPLDPQNLVITNKVKDFVEKNGLCYLHNRILSRSLFGIESDFISKNHNLARPYLENEPFDPETEVKLFTNDKAGPAGRSKWFIVNKDSITQNQQYIGQWQVVVSSAHGGGQEGRDNQLEIIDNHSAFGRARVAMASFESKVEAENFYAYMKSNLVRFMLLMTDEALTTLALKVPDLGNYRNDNDLISFTEDIDSQLFRLVGFTNEEISYIEKTVAKQGRKEMV